jgi:hypothetical protein
MHEILLIRLINTSYAVVHQTGRFTGERQNRLRQHGTLFFFSHKKIHNVNFFLKKIRFLPPCRRRDPPPNAESPDPCQY